MGRWVVLLVALSSALIGLGSCAVVDLSTNTTYSSRIAAFGPRISESINGILVPVGHFDPGNDEACEDLVGQPDVHLLSCARVSLF